MKRINQLKLPTCPYCGVSVWYIDAFLAKNKPLYKCSICRGKSAVLIKSRAFKLLWAVQIIAVFIFVMSIFLKEGFSVLGFILILVLFAGFYGLTPFMVGLKYARTKNTKKEDNFGLKDEAQILRREDTDTDIYSN